MSTANATDWSGWYAGAQYDFLDGDATLGGGVEGEAPGTRVDGGWLCVVAATTSRLGVPGHVAAIDNMAELNIGHAIISRAVMVGMKEAVSEMKTAIWRAIR